MWGIIPAAGVGKQNSAVGVFQGIIARRQICFVISPRKSDILEYYGARVDAAHTCFVVQPQPAGLCDALFRALPLIPPDEHVLVGLPDTVWFPVDGLRALPGGVLSFLLFPVEDPQHFDAVLADGAGWVQEIQVKRPDAASGWVWGAFKMPASVLRELFDLWCARDKIDEYVGTLVNAYLERGGRARAVLAGTSYLDVGTLTVKDLLVFQSLMRGSEDIEALKTDYPFSETAIFEQPGFPRMSFIEHSYSKDWWVPNRGCAEAMLGSAGFRITDHPEPEVFVCRRVQLESHTLD